MPAPLLLVIAFVLLLPALFAWWKLREYRRAEFIHDYRFPPGLFERFAKRRPALTLKDHQLVARGLRQYFTAYLKSGCRFVSMPSQVVDDLWHEFILYTRHYEQFCKQAFGRYFHHTPAVVLAPAQRDSNAGLRRCWWYCCREENINPAKPTRLPLLFALDRKLNIADGFYYAPDCSQLRDARGDGGAGGVHCGGDFSSSGVDGGTDGFGDSGPGSDGGGGGDGGGGASGGCGGGCGGGD